MNLVCGKVRTCFSIIDFPNWGLRVYDLSFDKMVFPLHSREKCGEEEWVGGRTGKREGWEGRRG